MSTEMWISECENICNFLSHKKDIKYFYENIGKENLILGIRLSLNEIKRVQLSLTADRL